ncbi:MAG: hypothetical protein KAR20_05435, partial [Candidatus Heimdallarchaeota archaeon]|nr:hypothetical protein [Candidatus Heimdallarchaeota archaeon]
EPWTPIIKNMALDYTASAAIEDIELIHLYPFEHTFVEEDLLSTPSVLPVFSEEGNLFIGLENLTPGNNLHILFQLAEATADSELNKAIVKWYYLKNDQWHRLLEDFDVLEDKTKGLTRSGIIKMAIPDDINDDNTIMPKDQYWLKVTALKNVKAIAKTINIHTQAARVTFSIAGTNDLSRLKTALPAGSIAKFEEANTNIKKVEQPYVGFAGKIPEKSNLYYRRVSEHLRHKGRAIARFDYERLLLERFDQISKAKCINHTHGLPARKYQFDFNMAPGFVLVAVIPNLEKLATGNLITPSAPVSLLEEIRDYLRAKNSTFIRLKIMNPRYERVNIETKVKLIRGKSEAFYKAKLENEMITQLAPWSAGDTSLLEFGRKVSKSDIIKFIESRDYVDYICSIKMQHGEYPGSDPDPKVLYPLTARSILTAGNMMISILDKPCEEYDDSGILCNDGIPELNGT